MMKKMMALGLLVALCMMTVPAMATEPSITGIEGEKIATPFWENVITYDWSIEKTANPADVEITSRDTQTVGYTVTATRSKISEVERWGVRGTITVTNTGVNPTQGLKIVDTVQYKTGGGKWQAVPGGSLTIIPPVQLAAGETKSYPYEIIFSLPVADAQYRNTAEVTITNHDAAHIGVDKGVSANTGVFRMPSSRTAIYIDESATASDALTCPTGFSCSSSAPSTWSFSDSATVTYNVEITNDAASCDSTADLVNTATLTECDTSGDIRRTGCTVSIYSGECPTGCTYTIGYWRNHAGFGPQDDVVTPLLPQLLGTDAGTKSITVDDAQTAVDILNKNVYGSSSNGITKLYAQLLAAKLNIANGADSAAIAQTIGDSDDLLAENDYTSWSGFSKETQHAVESWMTTLDQYNNGMIGPGHCNEELSSES